MKTRSAMGAALIALVLLIAACSGGEPNPCGRGETYSRVLGTCF